MEIKNYVITSNFDNLPLHVVEYFPSCEPKGVMQILHGMCEFKERYASFMQHFCDKGYIVVCYDQRGHGDSVKESTDLGYFYDDSAKGIVEDGAQLTTYLKEQYPNLPITLFGHSMGSMVARCYLREHDNLVDKVIVCGSPSKNPLAGIAIGIAKGIGLFRGKHHRSKMLCYLSTGKGQKNFPGEAKGAWLSQNRENIEAFYSNPKGKFIFTCNGFVNLFKLMKYTYKKKGYHVQAPTLPIHFISGSDDPVLVSDLKWFQSIEFLRSVGYENVTGKLYKGLRHEVFHDIGKEEVLADILAFMDGE